MQSVRITATFHNTSSLLINDFNFALKNHIFDLFFEYYYKQHAEKPKTITEANFEELIQIYEKALLEQIGYTEVPEVQSTSLRLEDNP